MRALTVLVVDDESSMRFLFRMLLESEGFEVIEAANGTDALARMEEDRPDLVLTDLMMPVMGGRELIDRLRGDERTERIPIVAVSARADPNVPGADAAMEKPFDVHSLVDVVRSLTERDGT